MTGPEAVILCGGLGRRLRAAVKGRPKPMAEVAGKPFLDLLLAGLRRRGVRRFVLCAGYRAGVIKRHYAAAADVAVSVEAKPLGTAGAVKNARRLIKGTSFLVLNGDSFCAVDLKRFAAFHRRKRALASVALAKPSGRGDVGTVRLAAGGRITAFLEKTGRKAGGLVNAGVYLLDRSLLAEIPAGKKYSFEYDLFPRLGRLYGFRTAAPLLDIGTPERYATAEAVLRKAGHLV
ncbi:MAG: NTP transferase domain-containing protein [Elusimicrobia bacterium]|nr:NTP transferase domain-containing protein [Elusimicrobiota bacterium]